VDRAYCAREDQSLAAVAVSPQVARRAAVPKPQHSSPAHSPALTSRVDYETITPSTATMMNNNNAKNNNSNSNNSNNNNNNDYNSNNGAAGSAAVAARAVRRQLLFLLQNDKQFRDDAEQLLCASLRAELDETKARHEQQLLELQKRLDTLLSTLK